MPNLRQQLREYFDSQALPAQRVDAILHAARAGGAVTEDRKVIGFKRWTRVLALAAALAIFAGLVFLVIPPQPAPAAFAALAPRVVEFFGARTELPKVSQDPAALHAWLVAKGAPAGMAIPAKLAGLESYGCGVVDVQGQPAYLRCFWRVKNADGTGGELIHLLAVRGEDFRDVPGGRDPQTRQIADWSFASWSEGAVTYTLAAAAPLEKVRAFLSVAPLSPARWSLAAVSF